MVSVNFSSNIQLINLLLKREQKQKEKKICVKLEFNFVKII